MFVNGVAQQSSTGAWAGGVRFSTEALSTALALATIGMTGYGEASTAGSGSFQLIDISSYSPPDGFTRGLSMDLGQNRQWGIGLDAFFNLAPFGEVVCLSRPSVSAGNTTPAPALNMSGSAFNTFSGEYIRTRLQSGGIGVQGITKLNGNATFHNGEFDSTHVFANWSWIRYRIDPSGANKRRRIRIWQGAFADESTTWDWDNTASQVFASTGGALGFSGENEPTGLGEFLVMAFMGFSENPDAIVPPGPADFGGGAEPAQYLANLQWNL